MAQQATDVPPHTRAVVVGGSMVGMAVARALSERFAEVVIVEKDQLPRGSVEHRRGVAQSWHVHNLMMRGQQELEELFPGFTDEAVGLGALKLDYGLDSARCSAEGFCELFETGLIALSASRQLLETAQRNRFFALCTEGVTLIESTRVTGLKTRDDGGKLRAAGVTTDNPEHADIEADLVVDCSGRQTRMWQGWLESLNLPLPETTVVDAQCAYASQFYRRPEGNPYPWRAMLVDYIYPDKPRWGVIAPLEHDTWVVTIGGINGYLPPSDQEGFSRFGDCLQTPLFSEWMQGAEPIGPVRTFRKIAKRWHHFERYDHPLGNFLAVGDSGYAFNPLYGQGMTAGVGCARILRDALREDSDLRTLQQRYYKAAHAFAYPPWRSTSLMDLAWPETVGERPWYTELNRRAARWFVRSCQYDDNTLMAFMQVAHLVKGPGDILRSWKVLRGLLRFTWKALTGTLPPQSFARPVLREANPPAARTPAQPEAQRHA